MEIEGLTIKKTHFKTTLIVQSIFLKIKIKMETFQINKTNKE